MFSLCNLPPPAARHDMCVCVCIYAPHMYTNKHAFMCVPFMQARHSHAMPLFAACDESHCIARSRIPPDPFSSTLRPHCRHFSHQLVIPTRVTSNTRSAFGGMTPPAIHTYIHTYTHTHDQLSPLRNDPRLPFPFLMTHSLPSILKLACFPVRQCQHIAVCDSYLLERHSRVSLVCRAFSCHLPSSVELHRHRLHEKNNTKNPD